MKIEGLEPSYFGKTAILISKGKLTDNNGMEFINTDHIALNLKWNLDTGKLCPDTWYYVWLYRTKDSANSRLMFSCSHLVPMLPPGYHFYAILPLAIRFTGKSTVSMPALDFVMKEEVLENEIIPFEVTDWGTPQPTIHYCGTHKFTILHNVKTADFIK